MALQRILIATAAGAILLGASLGHAQTSGGDDQSVEQLQQRLDQLKDKAAKENEEQQKAARAAKVKEEQNKPAPALAPPAAPAAAAGESTHTNGASYRSALSSGGKGPEMVIVPAGHFQMGSPSYEDEHDPRRPPQTAPPVAGSKCSTAEAMGRRVSTRSPCSWQSALRLP